MYTGILYFSLCFLSLQGAIAPEGLTTDLLDDTETVFQSGFPVSETLESLDPNTQQWAEIRTLRPSFSWVVRDDRKNVTQTAWQMEIAENREMTSVLWNSGRVESAESVSVFLPENAPKLREDGVYYWRVRTWNTALNKGQAQQAQQTQQTQNETLPTADEQLSPWSAPKGFRIGRNLTPGEVSRAPVRKAVELPVSSRTYSKACESQAAETPTAPVHGTFFDFGRAAFGQIRVTAEAAKAGTMIVRVGERVKNGAVDRKPAGSTRFWEYRVAVEPGTHTYSIQTRRDARNSSGIAFLVPKYIGEVMPFRYAEVEEEEGTSLRIEKVERLSVYNAFNETAARFHSSDESLNQVWDLCHYSLKATTFLGIYIDGDRERIPYEGDAFLTQLSHYGVDRDYSMARFSWMYMIFHPTWPTEWQLQCCQMAWYDYLYTGDTRGISQLYDELKLKSLIGLAEPNGLISTRKGKVTPEFLKSLHFSGGPQFRDIVDWPHKGLAGNENAESGETDGYVFQDFNTVVNAYHYFALNSMLRFSKALNKPEDAAFWESRLEQVRRSFQEVFFDSERGIYRDGESTEHASLHANIFPLAFGLVPKENRKSVTDFVRSRGMRCSVYGAQFLLEGVFNGHDSEYGLTCMTTQDVRGWLNMIRVGSTITLEAWDDRYKPNQDWTHPWGAAPANIIPRKLVGVEPIEPGCSKIRIQPQPASLKTFDSVVPTIRGPIHVSWSREDGSASLCIEIPANVRADVFVPANSPDAKLLLDGQPTNAQWNDGFFILPGIGSGRSVLEIREK